MRNLPMKISTLLLMMLLAAPAALADEAKKAPPSPESPEFPAYVLDRVDDMYRGAQSQGRMEMTIQTKHWKRTLEMDSWAKGRDYSLVRIRKPKKERGTSTLKVKKDMFIYLNKTGRTVKITSGMMGGSWMGSHMTNDDLVRQSRMARDFVMKLTFKGEDKGVAVYRFTLQAKPEAATAWDKLVVTVRQDNLNPLSQQYWDEDGKMVRLLTFSDYQKVGDSLRPMVMLMKPTDKPDEYTRIQMKKLDFSVQLEPSFFSIQKLKSF